MRKVLGIAIVLALLFTLSADASVGYKKDGDQQGNATSIDFRNGNTSFDGSTVTFYANGYKDGVTTNVSGESNLTSAALAYGIIRLADTGSLDGSDNRYIALANGTAGQMITIMLTADSGGSLYITNSKVSSAVFSMTKTGWSSIKFDDAGDVVTLLYVDDTTGWIIVGGSGVTIANA